MSAFRQRRAKVDAPVCPACDSEDVVLDEKQGHLVCQDCGVILEESRISETTEYRNFSEPDRPTGDPTRVAAGPLGVRVQVASQDPASFLLHTKARNAGTAGEDRFRPAYKVIGDAVAKSDLPQDVRDEAEELYALFASSRDRVSDMRATAAAAISRACKHRGVPRTLKELNKVMFPGRKAIKAISKAERELDHVLKRRMREEAERRGIDLNDIAAVGRYIAGEAAVAGGGGAADNTAHPSHAVARFGSDLGFTTRGQMLAKKVAERVLPSDLAARLEHRSWHGRQPTTLAAACLYLAMPLGKRVLQPGLQPRSVADVAAVCGVTVPTIEQVYAEMHPHLRSLLPAESIKPPVTEQEWAQWPEPDPRYLERAGGSNSNSAAATPHTAQLSDGAP